MFTSYILINKDRYFTSNSTHWFDCYELACDSDVPYFKDVKLHTINLKVASAFLLCSYFLWALPLPAKNNHNMHGELKADVVPLLCILSYCAMLFLSHPFRCLSPSLILFFLPITHLPLGIPPHPTPYISNIHPIRRFCPPPELWLTLRYYAPFPSHFPYGKFIPTPPICMFTHRNRRSVIARTKETTKT